MRLPGPGQQADWPQAPLMYEPWSRLGHCRDALYSVRRSHQGAPVVHRSVSELVPTDVVARQRCGHL